MRHCSEFCEDVSDRNEPPKLTYREDFKLNTRTAAINSLAEATGKTPLDIGVEMARAAFAANKVRSHGLGPAEEKLKIGHAMYQTAPGASRVDSVFPCSLTTSDAHM